MGGGNGERAQVGMGPTRENCMAIGHWVNEGGRGSIRVTVMVEWVGFGLSLIGRLEYSGGAVLRAVSGLAD